MRCAGTEKSFLSYLKRYDKTQYNITLLLAKKQGELLDKLPDYINIIEMPKPYGNLFLLNKDDATTVIFRDILPHHPLVVFKLLSEIYDIKVKKQGSRKMELWYKLMQLIPPLEGHYDEAFAYWGEKTMFYMLEKVSADYKINRQHFSYEGTPYAQPLYYDAYKKCDRIEHVAKVINDEFQRLFPDIADKAVFVPNTVDNNEIKCLSEKDGGFTDTDFHGRRILTIARLCPQKGLDAAAKAIKLLTRCVNVRWYIIGEGIDKEKLAEYAVENEIEDKIIFLGQIENPYPYIKQCNLYLQPSRYEGMPITVEEAKILEKPIVACDYLSAEEQLKDYDNSIICKLNEISLCDGILTLFNI